MFRGNGIEPSWVEPPSADQIIEKDRINILNSEFLTNLADEAEAEIIQRIIEKYPPEAIASAFVRSQMAGKSAPEELSSIGSTGPADFSNSAWFELSIGYRDKAEPRWLVAMLCRVGNMDKSLIGDIQIHNSTTFIEIASNGVQQLMAELKPDFLLEGKIDIKKLSAAPERIPTARARKFSSKRNINSPGSFSQNTKKSFKLKKEKGFKQKSESLRGAEYENKKLQKRSSQTLILTENTKSRDKKVQGGFNERLRKSTAKKNKSFKKIEGGKAPLKRKRV